MEEKILGTTTKTPWKHGPPPVTGVLDRGQGMWWGLLGNGTRLLLIHDDGDVLRLPISREPFDRDRVIAHMPVEAPPVPAVFVRQIMRLRPGKAEGFFEVVESGRATPSA